MDFVWKDGILNTQVSAEEQRCQERGFDLLLGRYPLKTVKHRTDMDRSDCSENESGSIVLCLLELTKKILGVDVHDDCFYIKLFSALMQTHCALVACDLN